MQPNPESIPTQVATILQEITEPYRARQRANADKAKYEQIIKQHSVVNVSDLAVYGALDRATDDFNKAEASIEASLKKIIAILPKSLVLSMRMEKKPFQFSLGIIQTKIWFDNFKPEIEILGISF